MWNVNIRLEISLFWFYVIVHIISLCSDKRSHFFLTFTYKYNQIQVKSSQLYFRHNSKLSRYNRQFSQYLLLHDIVYLICFWHMLFTLRFFFPVLCEAMTLCRDLASVFSLDCYCFLTLYKEHFKTYFRLYSIIFWRHLCKRKCLFLF